MEAVTKHNIQYRLDNMQKVCDILNVDIDEIFKIQFYNNTQPYKSTVYKITAQGLFYAYISNKNLWTKSQGLEGLLVGKHQIIKI